LVEPIEAGRANNRRIGTDPIKRRVLVLAGESMLAGGRFYNNMAETVGMDLNKTNAKQRIPVKIG
jgi:hypothetical protein